MEYHEAQIASADEMAMIENVMQRHLANHKAMQEELANIRLFHMSPQNAWSVFWDEHWITRVIEDRRLGEGHPVSYVVSIEEINFPPRDEMVIQQFSVETHGEDFLVREIIRPVITLEDIADPLRLRPDIKISDTTDLFIKSMKEYARTELNDEDNLPDPNVKWRHYFYPDARTKISLSDVTTASETRVGHRSYLLMAGPVRAESTKDMTLMAMHRELFCGIGSLSVTD